ncbi:MAG: septation protein SepH [Actinomycetes bacterium]
MRDLQLVGLSEDGTRLVVQLPGGEQFGLPVDEQVHAALRGDRARLGQLQIELESRLRPREIQARIRAGHSLDDVAAEAGISVERVERYAGPVLHEREHMAQLAAKAGVRRDDHGAVHLLGELVGDRLEDRGVPRDALTWDAWRRDDGGWEVRLDYLAGTTARSALWVYDSQRKTVVPDDEEARWLIAEEPQASVTPLRSVRERSPSDDLPQPADELDEVDEVDAAAPEPPVVVPDDVAEVIGLVDTSTSGPAADAHEVGHAEAAAPSAQAATPASRRKRASVPSWDEILFGSKKPD